MSIHAKLDSAAAVAVAAAITAAAVAAAAAITAAAAAVAAPITAAAVAVTAPITAAAVADGRASLGQSCREVWILPVSPSDGEPQCGVMPAADTPVRLSPVHPRSTAGLRVSTETAPPPPLSWRAGCGVVVSPGRPEFPVPGPESRSRGFCWLRGRPVGSPAPTLQIRSPLGHLYRFSRFTCDGIVVCAARRVARGVVFACLLGRGMPPHRVDATVGCHRWVPPLGATVGATGAGCRLGPRGAAGVMSCRAAGAGCPGVRINGWVLTAVSQTSDGADTVGG